MADSYRDPIDPHLKFLYQPRSLTVLAACSVGLLYGAFWASGHGSPIDDAKRGLLAAFLVFTFIGMLLLPNGPFIRPHPAIWRAVLAASIFYLLLLIVALFMDLPVARVLIGLVDGSLGRPLPEKSYAEDCRLTWSTLWAQIDFFVFAHVFGWYAKALILRDQWICWILSVMFEVMEYSLEFQLPNFAECWWDHWILDVLLCNWLGIWAGMKTCEYLSMKTYNWRSVRDIPNVAGKIGRSIAQLTPHSWITFDWASTRSFKGYLTTCLLITFFLGSELNAFYLKYLLWIPPEHPINTIRVILHGLAGCTAVRELYQYVSDPECGKLGAQVAVLSMIIIVETLISVKWSRGQFPNPIPTNVVRFWIAFSLLLVIFPLWKFWPSQRALLREKEVVVPPKTRRSSRKRKEF